MRRKSSKKNNFTWYTFNEEHWSQFLPPAILSFGKKMRRVFPGGPEYEEVIDLRYRGLVESGFIDPEKMDREEMRLERDPESMIIGLYKRHHLIATLTLNRISEKYPAMAMELEKKVHLDHQYFRHPDVLEFTKLVIAPEARGFKSAIQLLMVSIIIAKTFNKPHFWQVSRDVPEDISWRAKLGFDYSNDFTFEDPSLNNMKSRIGHLDINHIDDNPKVPLNIKRIFRMMDKVPAIETKEE